MKCDNCFKEIEDDMIGDYEAALVLVIKGSDLPVTVAATALNKHNPELMSKLIQESAKMSDNQKSQITH